ncbi:class I SAM-dependent methyltransferase [Halovivax sp.]|uniref:class I SAM-dependent methyltransferase n=1 Tax=Halovivax sp. TaxID=1935978 RepID=UPI0025C48AA3|nr:methyltransferase domain-containing protein [Halovivax sp.]
MSEHERGSTGWQLDRNGPEAYERYLVPGMFEPWADRLLDRVDLRASDRLLDVACGTGIVARRGAARMGGEGTVVGIDINEGMLGVAEASAADLAPRIEWRRGDATDLPFADERFDVACCQQALQFVEAPGVALEEMHRVLAPDGRIGVSVWRPIEHNGAYEVLADALARHVGDDAATMMRSPFPAWDADDLRSLVGDAGFDECSITVEVGSMRYPSTAEFVRREAASSPLAESLVAVRAAAQRALVRDVGNALEPYTDDEGIVLPMESYVLTARR